MIVCIAERVHQPALTQEQVDRWEALWQRDCLRCALSLPGMVPGCQTRNRLDKLLGRSPDRVPNLLSPDRKIGTWDVKEGRRCAESWISWLHAPNPHIMSESGEVGLVSHLVLLGARVADAFGWEEVPSAPFLPKRKDFGDTLVIRNGIRVMYLPHPSGRSRVLNTRWDELHEKAKEFVKW